VYRAQHPVIFIRAAGVGGPQDSVEVSMTKGYKIVGVVVGMALVAAVALGALFLAQPAAAAAVGAAVGLNPANFGGGGGALGCGQVGLDAAAKALNLTSADLQTQLRGGATLSDLATKANVKLADVEAAIDASCKAQTKAGIEAQVTAGTLTRDKADWLEQGLDKGYWGPGTSGGPAFGGFGGGFGGFGGLGRGGPGFGFGPGRGNRGNGNPNATPQATPSNTTNS
jgi:hypothetical protein